MKKVLLSVVTASAVAAAILLSFRARVEPLPPPAPAPSPHLPPPRVEWPNRFSVEVRALPPREALAPGTTRVLVLGDSVASFLGLALRYRQDELGAFVAARGVGQCTIFEAKVRIEDGKEVLGTSCSATWVEDTAELRPDVTLIVQGGAFFNDRSCEADWLASYEARIHTLIQAMGANAGRVVIAQVPHPMGRWRHSNVLERVDCFNGMLRRAASTARVPTLDLMEHLCPTRACIAESEGHPIRPDGLHFDGAGAEETARWALRELQRIARSEGASPPR